MNMIKLKNISFLALFLVTLGGCQHREGIQAASGANEISLENLDEKAMSADHVNREAEKTVEEKIIKTGSFRYEVQDLDKAFIFLNETTKKNGGFIENDNTTNQYGTQTRNLTVRIPSKNFDRFFESLNKEVSFFDNKSISSTNVTAQFIDVEARLKTKKALEVRYLELLGKTNKMTEIIEIEKSLSAVREDIESVQGQMNYLKDQISMSTMTIEIYKRAPAGTGATESYFSKIGNAFVSGFNSLSGFFISIIELWPYAIILALIITFVRKRKWRRTNLKNKSDGQA